MYLHSARKATYVVVMPVSCIEPCTISCMQQKKTDMSRTGVSHSCMVDMHSNVPHMRNTPATKHAANNTGREPVFMHARLQAMIMTEHTVNATFEGNLNFSLNITVKVSAIPTIEA